VRASVSSSGNAPAGGGSSGSGGGAEVVELSNGDTVSYDAMTGSYRSTDPLTDNYYEKENASEYRKL